MKIIGLIGGMSWESTAIYYEQLNKMVNQRLGKHHSAQILLYSVDFEQMTERAFGNRWDEFKAILVDAARRLEAGGADFVLLCANTAHIAAEEVERSVKIPLVHIADVTGERIVAQGLRRVALLGTAFTMEREFYRERLREKFGLEVIVPTPDDRKLVHDTIFDELVRGVVAPESKTKMQGVVTRLVADGAQGIILGCTELPMIIEQSDSPVPLFDTTIIHSEAAVERALA